MQSDSDLKVNNEHVMLKELILYIANSLASHPKFGATKLNKILFFSDFIAYARYGKSITGELYFKLEKGPAPRFLIHIRTEMEKSGDIVPYQQETLKGPQSRIAPKRSADLRKFSAEQISIVDQVIERLKDRDAEEVSDLSHFFIGWKMVRDREDIPYETVFIRDPKDIVVTERHRKIAEEIAKENAL